MTSDNQCGFQFPQWNFNWNLFIHFTQQQNDKRKKQKKNRIRWCQSHTSKKKNPGHLRIREKWKFRAVKKKRIKIHFFFLNKNCVLLSVIRQLPYHISFKTLFSYIIWIIIIWLCVYDECSTEPPTFPSSFKFKRRRKKKKKSIRSRKLSRFSLFMYKAGHSWQVSRT